MNEFLLMTTRDFVDACTCIARTVLCAWSYDVVCGESDGNKQFCLIAYRSVLSADRDWTSCKTKLFDALHMVGAINISGKVKNNLVRIYFNKRQRPMKQT